jgi:prolyl-tRNA editing enzyme YbaK/EbsC (Cys-tRNA(Pro) deacylase)
MEEIATHPSVLRVQAHLKTLGLEREITVLSDSARTAKEAADAVGIEVGQVASSIIFKLPNGAPLLVITSGRHRVDTELVANALGVDKLHRADADFVKAATGISIGGVSPFGWEADPTKVSLPPVKLLDEALAEYEVLWAAAGHAHAVFPLTYQELLTHSGATPMKVGD